jgi:AraC-like DNA-binding protein
VLVNHVRREGASWRFRVDSAGRAAGYCRKALDFMEINYMSTLSVKDIASAAGCSESALAHEFKKEYHETVMNRLQKIRIEQSLPHLLHGVNIQEAAELSGFSNEFYYSRVFRRIMGVPPGVYRSTKDII